MKKLFRTLLAVMVAVVMSFSVVALAGCKKPDPEPTPQPEGYEVNLTTGNPTYDAIIGTDFASFNLESTFLCSYNGSKSWEIDVNAKGNTDGSYADIEAWDVDYDYYYYFVRDWSVYETISHEEPITDFSKAELEKVFDLNDEIDELLGEITESGNALPAGALNSIDLGGVVPETLGELNYTILSLANAADAAVVDNSAKTVTVDFNKAAFNLLNQAKAVLNGLDKDVTVGTVLNNPTIKNYAKIATELLSAQDIRRAVAETVTAFAGMGNIPELGGESAEVLAVYTAMFQQIDALLKAVEPDANSSTYDYFVKVLGSQELVDIINGLIGQIDGVPSGFGLSKKITEFTLEDVLTWVNLIAKSSFTVDELLEMANDYIEEYTSGITETEFKVLIDGEGFSLSDAKIVYTYGADGSLASMDVEGEFSFIDSYYDDEEIVEDIETYTLTATLTLGKTAYAANEFVSLPDLGEEPVEPNIPVVGSVTGTYKFVSLKGVMQGIEVEYKVGENGLTEDTYIMTLNKDGSLSFISMGISFGGAWWEDLGKYYAKVNGDSIELNISGNTLTFESAGLVLTLKK